MRKRIDVPVRAHIHLHNRAMNQLAVPLLVDALKAGLVTVMMEGRELDLHLSAHDGWLSLREANDGYVEALIWRVR